MPEKAFQIEVKSRSADGRQVFALLAESEFSAQLKLERDRRILPDPVFSLQRMLRAADIDKWGLSSGSIAQIS